VKKYQDHYFKKAKQEKYPARSVYKLQEIDKRFHLLKKGIKVLDLGACPGSWTLFSSEKVGAQGQVVAIDLNPIQIKLPNYVITLEGDVFAPSEQIVQILNQHAPFHLVLSDMAPKTTGIKFADQSRSYELAQEALQIAQKYLIAKGNFVVKIFNGPDVPDFLTQVKQTFKQVKQFKPKSSRQESKEIFVIGLNKL